MSSRHFASGNFFSIKPEKSSIRSLSEKAIDNHEAGRHFISKLDFCYISLVDEMRQPASVKLLWFKCDLKLKCVL